MAHKIEEAKLIEATKQALCFSDVCRYLGIKPVGSNVSSVKKWLNKYSIDYSHFTGSAWNKGERYRPIRENIPLEKILVKNSTYFNTNSLRKRLIKEGIKEHRCECCNNTEWLGKPISLELHHIDGDRSNNELNNLEIICPNCHAQTETYCSKNMAR